MTRCVSAVLDTRLYPRLVVRRRHRRCLYRRILAGPSAARGGRIHTRLSTTRPLPSSNARSLDKPHRIVWPGELSTLFPCTGYAVLQPQRDHAYFIPYHGLRCLGPSHSYHHGLHAHANVSPPGPGRTPRSNRSNAVTEHDRMPARHDIFGVRACRDGAETSCSLQMVFSPTFAAWSWQICPPRKVLIGTGQPWSRPIPCMHLRFSFSVLRVSFSVPFLSPSRGFNCVGSIAWVQLFTFGDGNDGRFRSNFNKYQIQVGNQILSCASPTSFRRTPLHLSFLDLPVVRLFL